MKSKKALLIVDLQNDFCPGGALPVPEADEIVSMLNRYIELFSKKKLPVFASRDWHPEETEHFERFGGTWPEHCIQNTRGAMFHPKLKLPEDTTILSKGMYPDKNSYSAFQAIDANGIGFPDLLRVFGVEELSVGGLSTDYCVKWSVLDALQFGFKVNLLIDAIKAVNLEPKDSEEALQEMTGAGAEKKVYEELSRLMSEEIPRACDHVGLFTNDSDRLVNFYVEKLGFKKEKDTTLPESLTEPIFGVASDCRFVRLAAGNVMIEIFQPTSIKATTRLSSSTGLNHWGYCVGNRETFVEVLKEKSVAIIEVRRNAHRIYFIEDPDGNRIEIRD